jgi:hypothetical protein
MPDVPCRVTPEERGGRGVERVIVVPEMSNKIVSPEEAFVRQ